MTMMMRALLAAAVLVGSVQHAAEANDSSASLGAGGLRFEKVDNIALEREDLDISRSMVKVRYTFRNTEQFDFRTLVAFPLPALKAADMYFGGDIGFPKENPDNFVGFTVTVDGEPITPKHQTRAYVNGVDVTKELQDAGLPINPMGEFLGIRESVLEKLPNETKRKLAAIGAIDWIEGSELTEPRWRTQITYYWPMTFPAGKTVKIEHTYQPVVGAFFLTKDLFDEDFIANDFCTDEAFKKAALGMMPTGENPMLIARDMSYILTTANNWKGPIGAFKLTIDKQTPGHLVSLCLDGIKKTGPTTFEFEAKDFTPDRELRILFLEPLPKE